MFSLRAILLAAACTTLVGATTHADEFLLKSGGRLEGELTDAADTTHGKYVLRTPQGVVVTLGKEQLENVRRLPQEAEYDLVRHQHPDTVDGQWALAEWCKEHRLNDERKAHLERVIELDPNHKDARAALGYSKLTGQWKTREEYMLSLGKVQHKGEWMFPQEVVVLEQQQQTTQARVEWTQNLKRWREWFGTPKEPTARTNLDGVKDPTAMGPLVKALENEPIDDLRVYYVRAIGRIGSSDGEMLLAQRALGDRSPEVREICMSMLVDHPQPYIVSFFIQQLHSKDNGVVNAAARGLARFKDPRAISPLIDALVTKHKQTITTGSGGGMSATNSPMGSSFSTGSSTYTQERVLQNQGALDALLTLTGGQANYQFDVESWKHWHAVQKRNTFSDARRG